MKNKLIIISGIIVISIVAAILVFFFFFNTKNVNGSLDELMTKLYNGINLDELPKLERIVITSDNMKYFLGTDKLEFKEALASEPLISSIPHSVILIRAKENSDIELMKNQIKENIISNKLERLGVGEDSIVIESKGDLIVIILNDYINEIKDNFLKL